MTNISISKSIEANKYFIYFKTTRTNGIHTKKGCDPKAAKREEKKKEERKRGRERKGKAKDQMKYSQFARVRTSALAPVTVVWGGTL